MPDPYRPIARLAAAVLLVAGLTNLAGCGTINQKISAGMGDYIPHWAGGLPADAPPRPGTAQYDAWMQERERKRLLPATEREKDGQARSTTDSTSNDAVH